MKKWPRLALNLSNDKRGATLMVLNHSIISLRRAYISLSDDMVPEEKVAKIIAEETDGSLINQKIAESIVKRFESELDLKNVQAWAFLCKMTGII